MHTNSTMPNTFVQELVGTVMAVGERSFEVHCGGTTLLATRAVSCLVEPENGDLVAVKSTNDPEFTFIVEVLSRPSSSDARICAAGNLTVETLGRFSVATGNGIELVSKQDISAMAQKVNVTAQDGNAVLGQASLVADALTTSLDRLKQTVKRAYRHITESEHVRAGQIDCKTSGNLRLHGKNTLITATELVKADGQQIHMG